MNTTDTIAAPASAVGGAVTVIRISGPDALGIGNRVWSGRSPLGASDVRVMKLGKVGEEPVLAVYMRGPNSYTGDDVVELQCHGGAVAAGIALRKLYAAGARAAEPGEFTFRAFVNGKLDLTQAEAVSDLISSAGEAAFGLAARQLNGALGRELNELYDGMNDLRSECEARLDFPDEELDFATMPEAFARIAGRIGALLRTRDLSERMRTRTEIAIVGSPNVGKSSLLNRIAGYERAIVSEIPGTTRDTLDIETVIRGLPVRITDTAGIRESEDRIERLGIERSRDSMKEADVILWMLDASAPDRTELDKWISGNGCGNVVAVWNKRDLLADGAVPPETGADSVLLSAKTGDGVETLFDAILAKVFGQSEFKVPEVAVNSRCADALEKSLAEVEDAGKSFARGEYEIAAAGLRGAAGLVGEALGKTVAPDILDSIFKNFCIGK